jgi:hypothetical protein
MLGRPPEEKLRDSTERAQLEALQFLEGELRDSTSLGEHFREMLRGDKLLSEFTERQNASRAVSGALGREPTVYELLAQRPMRRPATPQNAAPRGLAQDAFDASFPPVCSASSPPDRLGFGTRDAFGTVKPTRPLTVGSANTALYLTSSNSISYPGRKLGLRASSLASLPSAVEVQLQSAATEGKLGGPSTFKVEDPIRNSYTVSMFAPYAHVRPHHLAIACAPSHTTSSIRALPTRFYSPLVPNSWGSTSRILASPTSSRLGSARPTGGSTTLRQCVPACVRRCRACRMTTCAGSTGRGCHAARFPRPEARAWHDSADRM